MRTAFVLSGGAALGAAQAGMLRGLYEAGIVPDLLVGTSVGGLNAAFAASRPPVPATADALEPVWLGLRRADAFPLRPGRVLRGLAGGDHVVSDRGLRRLLARHLELDRLEDAAIPVHVVAYDVEAGAERLLSSGPAAGAVLATSAVPGLLPPVRLGGRLLVDGGVADNAPVSHAVALGAERIFVLSTQPVAAGPPRTAAGLALHAFTLLIGSRLRADVAHHAGAVELTVIEAALPAPVSPADFGQARALIAAGHAAARSSLIPTDPIPQENTPHVPDRPYLSLDRGVLRRGSAAPELARA
jgi:NTE family protein